MKEVLAEILRIYPLIIFLGVEFMVLAVASEGKLCTCSQGACTELIHKVSLHSCDERASSGVGTVDFLAFKEVV